MSLLVYYQVDMIIECVGNSRWLKYFSRHNEELGHTWFHSTLMKKTLQWTLLDLTSVTSLSPALISLFCSNDMPATFSFLIFLLSASHSITFEHLFLIFLLLEPSFPQDFCKICSILLLEEVNWERTWRWLTHDLTQAVGGPSLPPHPWNVCSSGLLLARACPKTQPWEGNEILRLSGWCMWLSPVKNSM